MEYSSDDWETVETVTAASDVITIDELDVYPATYQFRVRTVIYENDVETKAFGLAKEGPNSEPLSCKIIHLSNLFIIMPINVCLLPCKAKRQ